MKKLISTLLAVVTVASVSAATPVSAACSSWTIIEQYTTCDYSDRCGVAWAFPATAYMQGTKERYCAVNGVQQRETTIFSEKSGCCA